MKELSIEEKAKRYDEALEKSKILYEQGTITESLCYVFPELKESEDEKIRKELIKFVKVNIPNEERYIAWLEKQGEQKPTDKVEPKFKNGQWIVWQNKCYKVNYNGCGYELIDQNGLSTSLECVTVDENAHLWTIQDAKDGDVLAFYSEYRGKKMVQVGIIEKYVGKHGGCSNTFKIYVGVNWDNNLQIDEYMGCSDIRPATKEQRDALMKAMADADYTFDFEEKELKKIEQKPAWSEEDERMYRGLHNLIYSTSYCDSRKEFSDFLNSLKDRVQIKPQQEWSEDDEKE